MITTAVTTTELMVIEGTVMLTLMAMRTGMPDTAMRGMIIYTA